MPRRPSLRSPGRALLFAVALVWTFGAATAPPAAPQGEGAPAGSPVEAPVIEAPTFDGLWETSYGRMRLAVDGDAVRGTYSYSTGSLVEGKVSEGRMEFRYTEPSAAGEGWFELAEDGQSFRGRWHADGTTRDQAWTGKRILPEAGIVWLVILEAHWEGSLAEEEYAFGDMLRGYFKMSSARHVRVRQRFFHDEADFKRFAGEVVYLAEPVVLLASTHGSPAGISVAGKTIGPAAIADCLRHAGNLELLHLSGCSMMVGPVPREIMEAVDPAERFPISGYSTSVAWDASAISDFTFLTFLLIHRLSPAEAVQRTHAVSPYTGTGGIEHTGFRNLGLRVLGPEEL